MGDWGLTGLTRVHVVDCGGMHGVTDSEERREIRAHAVPLPCRRSQTKLLAAHYVISLKVPALLCPDRGCKILPKGIRNAPHSA